MNFLTWLCAANIINNVSKPHFSFAHAIKENPQKAFQKQLKFTQKTTQKSVPNPIQTETQKKRSKKCCKLQNSTKNDPKWGPQKERKIDNFSLFLSIGTPLGTHMAPRASKRGPRKPPSLNFASFWLPFSHILATISTCSSHIFAADFLHFFK